MVARRCAYFVRTNYKRYNSDTITAAIQSRLIVPLDGIALTQYSLDKTVSASQVVGSCEQMFTSDFVSRYKTLHTQ